MTDQDLSLTLGQTRLAFRAAGGAGGLGYGLSVRTDDGSWRAVSAPDNPLVRGSTFNLYPTEVTRKDDFTLALRGTRRVDSDGGDVRRAIEYTYTATVQADLRQNWFRFDVEIDSP